MARIRNIKPEFWKNEKLGEMPAEAQLLFIGLWNLSDRRGFLENRPKRIKAELFPYREIDIIGALNLLEGEFIKFIEIGDKSYIQIVNFQKHQVCNVREPESTVPEQYWNSTGTLGREGKGKGMDDGDGIHGSTSTQFSYLQSLKNFSDDVDWKNTISAKYDMTTEKVDKEMISFLDNLKSQGQFPRNINDTRKYFDACMKKDFEKRKANKNKPKVLSL